MRVGKGGEPDPPDPGSGKEVGSGLD